MRLSSIKTDIESEKWTRLMGILEEHGIVTVADWVATSKEELERVPLLGRKTMAKIHEAIGLAVGVSSDSDIVNSKSSFETKTKSFMWDGKLFNDDRLFILDLQLADKNGVEVWAVVTRWNHEGMPPYKVNDFPTQMEAIRFIKEIEPQTPRISLSGESPSPSISYLDYLELAKKNGEPTSFALYEAHKLSQRKLILQAVSK